MSYFSLGENEIEHRWSGIIGSCLCG